MGVRAMYPYLVPAQKKPVADPPDPPKRQPPGPKRHALIEAGATGDRLAILEASLAFTLETLAAPNCPASAKVGLLTKVDKLSASIAVLKAERKREAEEAYDHDDGDAETWDAAAI